DAAAVDERPHVGDTALGDGDERLTAPSRVHRQDEHELEIIEQGLDCMDGRARVQRDSAHDAGVRETLQHTVRVDRRLNVERQDPRSRVDVRADLVERRVDHQVDVLHEPVRQRLHDGRSDGRLRAEHTVHDVDMHDLDTGGVELLELLPEAQEVRGEDADAETGPVFDELLRRDPRHACTAERASSWNTSYPSTGVARSCTTLATAWIIAAGDSDWKRLRPMSTPAAPSCTAR